MKKDNKKDNKKEVTEIPYKKSSNTEYFAKRSDGKTGIIGKSSVLFKALNHLGCCEDIQDFLSTGFCDKPWFLYRDIVAIYTMQGDSKPVKQVMANLYKILLGIYSEGKGDRDTLTIVASEKGK